MVRLGGSATSAVRRYRKPSGGITRIVSALGVDAVLQNSTASEIDPVRLTLSHLQSPEHQAIVGSSHPPKDVDNCDAR